MSSSSNDLLADRRFAWARSLAEDGDHAAAADLLDQVVTLVPAWAPGWAALAEARERVGDGAAARAAWSRVDALDAEGRFGAGPNLARLEGRTPDSLPASYLRALFDDYAPRFDRHLVEALDYRGPDILIDALERAAPGRHFGRALDLGCGTGLMGRRLAGRAEAVDGVDLSPAMVERARATGCYAALSAGSLEAALGAAVGSGYDLVIAADVFVYVGDLAPVVAAAAEALSRIAWAGPRDPAALADEERQTFVGQPTNVCLAHGGLLAFTVQAGDTGFTLGPDMRFSHSGAHVAAALAAAGLTTLLLEPASTRREKGRAVPGFVVVAER